MNFTWDYPLYLIQHGGGFASVVSDPADEQPLHSVVVFTRRAAMTEFMAAVQLEGRPRRLNNDREFSYVLQGLQPPATQVAFDAAVVDNQMKARWQIAVESLLEDHLPWAASPWDYPVFVVAVGGGFASIEGHAEDRGTLVAVGLFTDERLAERYVTAAGIRGQPLALSGPPELSSLLRELQPSVTAVAVDPTVRGGRRRAKWCVEVSTLLEKYLP